MYTHSDCFGPLTKIPTYYESYRTVQLTNVWSVPSCRICHISLTRWAELLPSWFPADSSWKTQLSWDEPLTRELQRQWSEFAHVLSGLSQIYVPRFVRFSTKNCQVQLIGFADASARVYAATVYLHCTTNKVTKSNLLVAKSKVAPASVTSIPHLELCGALLLAKLIKAKQQKV